MARRAPPCPPPRGGGGSGMRCGGMAREGVLVPGSKMFAGLELVGRAAVGALGRAGLGDVQVDLGVGVPQLHAGLGRGAEHAALCIQVLGQQFDGGGGAHGVQTLVSQWAYLGLRPFTMSKNALWIFSVMGPREPAPICTRSSSRIGVTSAAVPVKKASSAM